MRTAALVLSLLASTIAADATPPQSGPAADGGPPSALHRNGDRTIDCDTLFTFAMVRSFEMVATGDGAVHDVAGFDVTPPPTDRGAYSADWYRDVLQGNGSVLDLPGGMQADGGWFFVVAGPNTVIDHWSAEFRWTRGWSHPDALLGNDYELRFTNRPNKAIMLFTSNALVAVPFEIWCLRGTPASRGDDVRMIPWIFDEDGDDAFSFQLDHQASDDENDPYSDWLYFVMPEDSIPGEAGYNRFVEAAQQGDYNGEGNEHMARVVLMNWDRHQGESAPGAGDGPINAMPDPGTVIRLRFLSEPDTLSTSIVCRTTIDVNRWRVALTADGRWAEDTAYALFPGAEWPKDSGQFLIFAAGSYVGTTMDFEPSVSQIEWFGEFQPGDILNETPAPIDSLVAGDPADPLNRVFVIDTTRSGQDWEEWPFEKGAPADPNGDPLLVSDQDSWTVFNDLDANLHDGTSVLGLEIQRSTYGFVAGDAVGDAFFIRWRVTNKSATTYADTYFGIWMDPDLETSENDLVGVDTLRSMAYVYNADDGTDHPIAMGLDFLRGPEDGSGDPLPLTSFTTYINGADPSWDAVRLNYLKGLDADGNARPNGPFDFPGDPVTGQGWIDDSPSDRRWILASGPFTLHPGETKEVLAACIAASGADRLDAIVRLREADDIVQTVFNRAGVVDAEEASPRNDRRFLLAPCRPNPFTAGTTLSFSQNAPGLATLDLWNILGQKVRTLLRDERRSASTCTMTWDGRDQSGKRLPSGMYICRLSINGRTAGTRRVHLLH